MRWAKASRNSVSETWMDAKSALGERVTNSFGIPQETPVAQAEWSTRTMRAQQPNPWRHRAPSEYASGRRDMPHLSSHS